MKYTDPINGNEITVRSVYVPARTLLQGAPIRLYHNTVLSAVAAKKPTPKVQLKGFK